VDLVRSNNCGRLDPGTRMKDIHTERPMLFVKASACRDRAISLCLQMYLSMTLS
jgi:hypothetical protein